MEAMREQDTLSQHPLVSSSKLDLGDGERVPEMQDSVHVGVWKVSEPFGELFLDLFGGEASDFLWRWGVYFKDAFGLPTLLVLLLQGLEVVPLSCLCRVSRTCGVREEDAPEPVRLWRP